MSFRNDIEPSNRFRFFFLFFFFRRLHNRNRTGKSRSRKISILVLAKARLTFLVFQLFSPRTAVVYILFCKRSRISFLIFSLLFLISYTLSSAVVYCRLIPFNSYLDVTCLISTRRLVWIFASCCCKNSRSHGCCSPGCLLYFFRFFGRRGSVSEIDFGFGKTTLGALE